MNNIVYVKIPLFLLVQTIYILELIDTAIYDKSIQIDYDNVLNALNKKKESLELREAYSAIIRSKDDDARHLARMRYLDQKRAFRGDF